MERDVVFVGTGVMGSSMVRNLLRGGCRVHVFNRTPVKSEALKIDGATAYNSLEEALQGRSEVFLSVSDDVSVCDVVAVALQTMKAGGLIVDLSTIRPGTARDVAQRLLEKKIGFLDAPVSGGDIGARQATLTIMAGGTRDDFDRAEPYLRFLGKKIVHMGSSGAGQMTKAVNQVMVALSVAAMTEGLVLAKSSGLNVEQVLDVVRSGAAGSWSLENYAPRILRGELGPGFFAKHMLKDLRIALSEADEHEAILPVSSLVKELYMALCAHGGENLGNHALIALYDALMKESSSSLQV